MLVLVLVLVLAVVLAVAVLVLMTVVVLAVVVLTVVVCSLTPALKGSCIRQGAQQKRRHCHCRQPQVLLCQGTDQHYLKGGKWCHTRKLDRTDSSL